MTKVFFLGKKFNKKGNLSVMLSMFFASLLLIAVVLVNTSSKVSNYSYCDCVLQLAGRSILSEYHLALKENYGIMAFKSYNKEVNNKIKFYANSSFKEKTNENNLTLIKPKLKNVECNMNSYSLTNVDNLENDIIDFMKYPKLRSKQEGVESYKGEGDYAHLVNQKVINNLPSKNLQSDYFNIKEIVSNGIPSLEELMSNNTKNLIVNEYILNNFNYRLGLESNTETFFRNEAEYILYGDFSDEENKNKFIRNFKALRVLLNTLHICLDKEKRIQIETAAATITPGPEAAVTAIILTEVWAYAEAVNDAKLLVAGENVALYKKGDNWAIDLDSLIKRRNGKENTKLNTLIKENTNKDNSKPNSLIENSTNKNSSKVDSAINESMSTTYIKPNSDKGLDYKDYLRVFLYFEDRETKLMRMMDLIQINIQGGFDESFYIKDCYIGLDYKANVNGQEYAYVQIY